VSDTRGETPRPRVPTPGGIRNSMRRGKRLLLASALVFLALAGAGVLVGGGEAVLQHLGRLSAPLLLATLALSLANYLLRAWRWHRYSRALGLDIGARDSVLYFLAGLSMGATPGKLGETLRLWMIERDHGYGYSRTIALFVADRLADVQALLLLCLAPVGGFVKWLWPTVAAAVAVVMLTLALARGELPRRAAGMAYAASGRRAARWFAHARRLLRLTARLQAWRVALPALALGVVAWSAECLAFHLILDALGSPTAAWQAVFIYAFASIAGAASMLPGGIGGFEAASVLLLAAAGVSPPAAVAATAVVRLVTLWFSVGLGLAVLPLALRPRRPSAS